MYSRLFGSILDSSINITSVPTEFRWLWVTMLLIADESRVGVVDMPPERLAAKAGLRLEDTLRGLEFLASPDKESRSDELDGSRIVALREGSMRLWKLVNWEKYAKIASEEQRREETRIRVAEWRKKQKAQGDVTFETLRVTKSNASEVASPATKKQESKASSSPRKRATLHTFADDSPEMTASRYLFGKIRENVPSAIEPNWQGWAREFDLIFRVDGRTKEEVLQLINFSQRDSFWRRNILSPGTLRKQWVKLEAAQLPDNPKAQAPKTAARFVS